MDGEKYGLTGCEMKYMTFNSSCSYAGVANMLEQYGLDTGDRAIALAMKLPYLFTCCDGVYLSGPMLQTAQWFNLYLHPVGYEMVEKTIPADEVAEYLKTRKTAMLGIFTEEAGKHAVVYKGLEGDRLVFLNNKWETEESPEKIRLTAEELRQRIDGEVAVATVRRINPTAVDFREKLEASITALRANLEEILALSQREATVGALCGKLNTLFRPLFLDGITMLNMIGEETLAAELSGLQRQLLQALRQEPDKRILLKEYVSANKLRGAAEKYMELIKLELERCEG